MQWRTSHVLVLAAIEAVVLAGIIAVAGRFRPQPASANVPQMPPAPEDALHALPSPDDAVRLAFEDAQGAAQVGADTRLFWYIWVQDGTDETAAAVRNALALVSRASYLPVAPAVRQGDVLLVRADLSKLSPQQDAAAQDLVDYLRFRDDFQFDPAFSLLLTRDVLRFAGLKEEELPRAKKKVKKTATRRQSTGKHKEMKEVEVPLDTPVLEPDGKTLRKTRFVEQEVEVEDFKDVVEEVETEAFVPALEASAVVRLNSRDINQAAFVGLQELLHTPAPIISDGYFLTRALSTIRDENVNEVFATVYGGEYYRLRGIRKAKDVKGKEKSTDLDLFLENLGVGFIGKEEKLTADQIFDRLRSDQRLAMFRSGVTGKERRIDLFDTLDGREVFPWIAVTHDFKDANIDLGTSPIANLLRVRADAFEVIAATANGTLEYALFDDKESLLDEAAADVVADHEIPAPYTRRLQSAISCIRCHGKKGQDNWQDMANDVKTLLLHDFDPFADVSDPDRSQADVRDRLRGLYTGDFSVTLQRVRDDQARTTLTAGGILWNDKDDPAQKEAAWHVSQRISARYADYNFTAIDAGRALRDLGVHAPANHELETLRQVLALDPKGPVVPEDPIAAGLLSGLSVTAKDFQLHEGFIAARAKLNIAKLLQDQN